eukprot:Nk52_evm11s243 gene=Nk52_evmTU11s243
MVLVAEVNFTLSLEEVVNNDLFERGVYQVRFRVSFPKELNACETDIQLKQRGSAADYKRGSGSGSVSGGRGLSSMNGPSIVLLEGSYSSAAQSPASSGGGDYRAGRDGGGGGGKYHGDSSMGGGSGGSGSEVDEKWVASSTFSISYINQRVVLGEGVSVTLSIPLPKEQMTIHFLESVEAILELELWFCSDTKGSFFAAPEEHLQRVAKRKVRLRRPVIPGLHSACFSLFSYRYFCSTLISVHSSLIRIENVPSPFLSASSNNARFENLSSNVDALLRADLEKFRQDYPGMASFEYTKECAFRTHQCLLGCLCLSYNHLIGAFYRMISACPSEEQDVLADIPVPLLKYYSKGVNSDGIGAGDANDDSVEGRGRGMGGDRSVLSLMAKDFSTALRSVKSESDMADLIMDDVGVVSDQLTALWELFKVTFGNNSSCCRNLSLQRDYSRISKRMACVFVHVYGMEDCYLFKEKGGKSNVELGSMIRRSKFYSSRKKLDIEEFPYMESNFSDPIIFEDRFELNLADRAATLDDYFQISDNELWEAKEREISKLKRQVSQNEGRLENNASYLNMLAECGIPSVSLNHLSEVNISAVGSLFNMLQTESDDKHLVVCVHGLSGNEFDLRLVKNYLAIAYPDLDFLMVSSIENATFGDLEIMTDNLVQEILDYVEDSDVTFQRLSFIGHSMGAILIRSILASPLMEPFLPKLHTFLSLSGPHIGSICSGNTLVSTGMWVLQKVKGSDSMAQLRLGDAADYQDTFLYKLSRQRGLEFFKHVLLVASSQDKYVPFHSARIEKFKGVEKYGKKGDVFEEMVHNILDPIIESATELIRYDVVYKTEKSTLDSMIGRSAHIAMLDSVEFLEMFISSILQYFK